MIELQCLDSAMQGRGGGGLYRALDGIEPELKKKMNALGISCEHMCIMLLETKMGGC